MFADDLTLMTADTIIELQRQLNVLSYFCHKYKLQVNERKTKIVVFTKGGLLAKTETWHYRNTKLEVFNKFCYLNLLFTRQVSMNAIVLVHEQGIKGKPLLCYGSEEILGKAVDPVTDILWTL